MPGIVGVDVFLVPPNIATTPLLEAREADPCSMRRPWRPNGASFVTANLMRFLMVRVLTKSSLIIVRAEPAPHKVTHFPTSSVSDQFAVPLGMQIVSPS